MTKAIDLPVAARLASGQPSAMKISMLIPVSSRKSTLSASRETEPATRATANSTKKYDRFSIATVRTIRRSRRASSWRWGTGRSSRFMQWNRSASGGHGWVRPRG